MIKRLDSTDFGSLKALLLEQRTFMGSPIELFPSLLSRAVLSRLLVNLINQDDELILGEHVDGVLQGAGIFSFIPKRQLWIVRLIIIREALKKSHDGLPGRLLEAATGLAEARGFYRHLMIVPAAHVSKKQTWSSIAIRSKYTVFTGETVPAGALPTNELYREVLYRGPYPVDTCVRDADA